MADVLSALKKGQTAALEAPTGFGKTLCLLAACRAFVRMCRACRERLLACRLSEAQADFVRTTKLFEGVNVTQDGQVLSGADEVRRFVLQGNTQPKLVYCTRTHAQAGQVSSQMKLLGIVHAVMGSRKRFCVNETVKEAVRKGASMDDVCKYHSDTGRCLYREQQRIVKACEQFLIRSAREPMDVEDMVGFCIAHQACPFYIQRELSGTLDAVVMPYNYIVGIEQQEQNMRPGVPGLVAGNILVFDEGHNVPDACCEACSAEFSYAELGNCIVFLEYALSLFKEGDKRMERELGPKWAVIEAKKFVEAVMRQVEHISSVPQNRVALSRRSTGGRNGYVAVDLTELYSGAQFQHAQAVAGVISNIEYFVFANKGTSCFKNKLNARALEKVCYLAQVAEQYGDKMCLILQRGTGQARRIASGRNTPQLVRAALQRTRQQNETLQSLCISVRCFTPHPCVELIQKQHPQSIIVTSGTLQPVKSLNDEFQLAFDVKHSYNHVCPRENYESVFLETYRGSPVIGTYERRTDQEYREAICYLVNGVTQKQGCGGTLVFFNSYQMLGEYRDAIEGQNVFFEPQDNDESTRVLACFRKQVRQGQAVLCCVHGGRYSEGVDFAGIECRRVVVLGIPYASIAAPAITERIKRCGAVGRRWYETHAYRLVSQAAGRCLRSKDDVGQIVFADSRFIGGKEMLSTWIVTGSRSSTFEQFVEEDAWLQEHAGKLSIADIQKGERHYVNIYDLVWEDVKDIVLAEARWGMRYEDERDIVGGP